MRERSAAVAAESAGMMSTLKPKHRPFCFSVKGHVKMLRLVRPGHRVGAVLGRAQGQREMALKYKEESPTFSFSLGLPEARRFTVHPGGRRRERRHCPALQGFTDTFIKPSKHVCTSGPHLDLHTRYPG